MKRLIAFVYLIFSLTIISAQNVCHIIAEYSNWGDTLLVHTTECSTGREIDDTVLLKNGNFSYDIELKSPAIMNITTPAFLERKCEGQIERFVIVPGDSIKCKGYQEIKGTSFFQQYAKIRSFIKSSAYRNSEDKYQAILDYVIENKDNEACIALITDYNTYIVMDETKMEEAFSLLSPKVRNGRMRPLFDFMLKQIQKNESKRKRQPHLIGTPAKDFQLKDTKGKEIGLSTFRGKYILLDFWGSWCQPCLKALPKLKDFYEENKNKVVIIGIGCHDNEIRWRKTIEKNQLTWYNVLAPKDNKILEDYQITNYPTQIFISPDGHILNYTSSPYSDIYASIKKVLEVNQ
ncbi:TlpA family protein disulfide reductase [Segatella buccae]|uniref:TlpA family protein disulfide reductase n=1 Tax=Segatella buccae TaxID=28126 RepID=UPI00248E200C|nr:TlpA disulfide reductase family protein [Segatella buccae]